MERRVTAVLWLVLLVLGVELVFGDNPWTGGIAERLREGDPVRSIDYARTYGWWMALVNAVVVVGLLWTRRLWLVPGPVRENPPFAPPGRADLRWFVPLVAGAMATLALLAAPRLDDSLWGDELWTVERAIDGKYVRDESGRIEFDQLGWRETFFEYRKPSNHVGYTVVARLCLATWRTVTQPRLKFVNEAALRLPAWLAGIASLGVVALLLRRLGMPGAGVFAAWVLGLHPWVIRYASEARGYAFLLLLCPLSLLALWRALHRGTWGHWAVYGLAQFWMMWTWPSIGFHVAVLNAAAVLALWRVYRGRPQEARVQWLRWGVVSLVGGLLFLQLMLGGLFQLAEYAARDWPSVRPRFLQHLGAFLLAGVSWRLDHPPYPELVEVARAWPRLFWGWVGATLLGFALGAARLVAGGWVRALVGVVLVVPGPALLLWAWLEGAHLNEWSLIFALPGLALLLGAGLSWPARALPRAAAGPAAAVLLGAWLGVFAGFTGPLRAALRAESVQPVRESVLRTRPDLDPFSPANRRILTASIHRPPSYYDPNVIEVDEPGELRALMRRADREGRPLFVNWGRPGLAAERVPELIAMLEDPELFEEVAVLHGYDPRGLRRVHRYRGREDRGPAP